jgi:tryptophanyl-tRNA synthetase
MSKSYGNHIEVFEPVKAMRKKVMRIATDSRPMEDPKQPESDHLFQLFSLFGSQAETEELAQLYRAGGFGYGEVKKKLADAAENYFSEAHQRRAELESNLDHVREILAEGAIQARQKASQVLDRAKAACGL